MTVTDETLKEVEAALRRAVDDLDEWVACKDALEKAGFNMDDTQNRAEALEEAAAKADDWTLTAEEVANGTGWPANVGENIGDAIRALKGGSNG